MFESSFDPTDTPSVADASPDFSDVVGGSSTYSPDLPPIQTGGLDLGSLGTQIAQYFGSSGGPGGSLGPAVGQGLYGALSGVGSGVMKALGLGRRRHRRMNPGNFKALRRSMHRLQAFERAARKVVHFTHPKPTARVKFKFRRRRRR